MGAERERTYGDPDCEAHDRGVLVPWNTWHYEFYKPMGALHDADRGGFIFAPKVRVHEDIRELHFVVLDSTLRTHR